MKNITKTAMVVAITAAFLAGCESTDAKKNSANTPETYCQSVGGEVKSVSDGAEVFCLLPGGDVVEINAFYQNNH